MSESDLKMICIAIGLAAWGLLYVLIRHLCTPNHWWSNRARRLGLIFATFGIAPQLGLLLYNNHGSLTPTERIELREVAAKSQAQACQEAGYLADSHFWDDVHHYFSSHHFYEGSFASRLLCMDKYHLAHEIFPPTCNARNLKACK